MNAQTSAINPYASSLPSQGLTPSYPPPNSTSVGNDDSSPSPAEIEALRQQLSQAQQKQNPLQKAWNRSLKWLKKNWPIALGVVAVAGGGGYFALNKIKGNNNRQMTGVSGGFLSRVSGGRLGKRPEKLYEEAGTRLEKSIRELTESAGNLPGTVAGFQQVMQELLLQQALNIRVSSNNLISRIDAEHKYNMLRKLLASKAKPLTEQVNSFIEEGEQFSKEKQAEIMGKMKEILNLAKSIDPNWLSNLDEIHLNPTPSLSNLSQNTAPRSNNNHTSIPTSPPTQLASTSAASQNFLRQAWKWATQGGRFNPRLN